LLHIVNRQKQTHLRQRFNIKERKKGRRKGEQINRVRENAKNAGQKQRYERIDQRK
jgi:hypothetical protein